MTATMTYSNKSPKRMLIMILMLAVVLSAGMYIPLNRHAIEKHGAHAIQAAQCYNENGPTFEMIDPIQNRKAMVCHDDRQEYGWYIIIVCGVSGCLITAFKRERAKRRHEVRDYLRGNGFKDLTH